MLVTLIQNGYCFSDKHKNTLSQEMHILNGYFLPLSFFRFEFTFHDIYNVVLAAIIRVFYDALQYVSIRLPRSGGEPPLLNPFDLLLDPCHGLGFVPDLWPKGHFLANPLQKILQILRSLCVGNPVRDMTISPHLISSLERLLPPHLVYPTLLQDCGQHFFSYKIFKIRPAF